MKKILSFALMMLCPALFASELELDLSGTWELTATITEDDVPYTSVLHFERTSTRTEFGGELYRVVGDLDGIKVLSASIELLNNEHHLVWWLERDEGVDLESNLILQSAPDYLSLGGDFEPYEVATMKRVAK